MYTILFIYTVQIEQYNEIQYMIDLGHSIKIQWDAERSDSQESKLKSKVWRKDEMRIVNTPYPISTIHTIHYFLFGIFSIVL